MHIALQTRCTRAMPEPARKPAEGQSTAAAGEAST